MFINIITYFIKYCKYPGKRSAPYNPTIGNAPIGIGLALIGTISPLLTFTTLFQQKEWRRDRLREHLRHEGWWNQLMGRIQPAILCLWIIGWIALPASRDAVTIVALGAFAVKSALQVLLGRQRLPVWTSKAMLITCLAVLITIIATIIIPFSLLPILPPLQPVSVMLAWATLIPLDAFVKRGIFHRAMLLRESWHDATVIGIAGSVGKTTTKELLRHLLQDLNPLATPEHVNTEMGVAQWMLSERVASGNERSAVLIVEMGAYRKGEIELMCSFVKPTFGVVTALGSDHLALFGSEQAIIDANAELIESLPVTGQTFLYADNDATRSIAERSPCPVTLAGLHDGSQVTADHIERTDKGLRLTLAGTTVDVALHGLHNAGNILMAIAVAETLGIPKDRIRELLQSFQPLRHTFHVYREHNVLLLDDTYNSSRLSIAAALDWASHRTEKSRVLLMSDLQETGSDEDRFLEELGAKAHLIIDRAIFTTDTGRRAFEMGYGKPVELLGPATQKVPTGSLLLCIGRMPLSYIQRLLPEPEPQLA